MFARPLHLLKFGLRLGGLISFLPSSTLSAKSRFNYPDGSVCFQCTGNDVEGLCEPELYKDGGCMGGVCSGTYYPSWYHGQQDQGEFSRECWSDNKCLYQAQVYDSLDLALSATEACCFKPASQVRIFFTYHCYSFFYFPPPQSIGFELM